MIFLDKLIKHRGCSSKNVEENTLLGIKKALASDKYVGCEFDIRTTLDNEFILFHDTSLNNKLIKNTLYKELPKYVPRLIDVLNIKSDKIFLVEIKDINDNYERLFKLLNKYKNKNIYVMSFSKSVIAKMDKEGRTYKIGVLNYVLNTTKDDKKLDFIAILNSFLTNTLIQELKGLEIFSYGLISKNEPKKFTNVYYITDE